MASSEVQTDPGDPLGKLVERLDRLSTREEDGAQAPRVTPRLPDVTGELKETCELALQYYLVICEAPGSGVLNLFRLWSPFSDCDPITWGIKCKQCVIKCSCTYNMLENCLSFPCSDLQPRGAPSQPRTQRPPLWTTCGFMRCLGP